LAIPESELWFLSSLILLCIIWPLILLLGLT